MGYISVFKCTGIFSLCVLFNCILQVSDLESSFGSNTQKKRDEPCREEFPWPRLSELATFASNPHHKMGIGCVNPALRAEPYLRAFEFRIKAPLHGLIYNSDLNMTLNHLVLSHG